MAMPPALFFKIYGDGLIPMLAFHGIGQDHRCWETLSQSIGNQYTIYAFDLYFHGQSPSLNAESLSKPDWKLFLENFLEQHQINQCAVVGFSMGGKFALCTYEAIPERVIDLWLLAPDGITVSPWYKLATGWWLTKSVFGWYMKNYDSFRKFSNLMVRFGMISKSSVKFAQSTLATPEQRQRVFRSWVGFRLLNPDIKQLSQTANCLKTNIRIYLGEYDALLPLHYVDPLHKHLNNCELNILKTGHHRLVEKVAELLK